MGQQTGLPQEPRRSSGTILEPVENLRQLVQKMQAPHAAEATEATAKQNAGSRETPSVVTVAFRPRNRPPMASLCVHFDGEDDGHQIAVYSSPYVIGRVEGNLVIDHDTEISSRHAELLRVAENGRSFWQLHDLNSTNGTFVRAAVALLKDQQEVLLGGQRLRFADPTELLGYGLRRDQTARFLLPRVHWNCQSRASFGLIRV